MDVPAADTWRRLRDMNLLVPERCRPDELVARETVHGRRRRVIRLKRQALYEEDNRPDQPDPPDRSDGSGDAQGYCARREFGPFASVGPTNPPKTGTDCQGREEVVL